MAAAECGNMYAGVSLCCTCAIATSAFTHACPITRNIKTIDLKIAPQKLLGGIIKAHLQKESTRLGNGIHWGWLRAASVHAGLASLVEREGANLEGRRILMYSYGSGLAASLWSVIGRRVEGKFALSSVSSKVCTLRIDLQARTALWKLHMLTGSLLQRASA